MEKKFATAGGPYNGKSAIYGVTAVVGEGPRCRSCDQDSNLGSCWHHSDLQSSQGLEVMVNTQRVARKPRTVLFLWVIGLIALAILLLAATLLIYLSWREQQQTAVLQNIGRSCPTALTRYEDIAGYRWVTFCPVLSGGEETLVVTMCCDASDEETTEVLSSAKPSDIIKIERWFRLVVDSQRRRAEEQARSKQVYERRHRYDLDPS